MQKFGFGISLNSNSNTPESILKVGTADKVSNLNLPAIADSNLDVSIRLCNSLRIGRSSLISSKQNQNQVSGLIYQNNRLTIGIGSISNQESLPRAVFNLFDNTVVPNSRLGGTINFKF